MRHANRARCSTYSPMPLEILDAARSAIVDCVVRLVHGFSFCSTENHRVRTVLHVCNRQAPAGPCPQQHTAKTQPQPCRQLPPVRAIYMTRPHNSKVDATFSQEFYEQPLLPDLGMRINIPLLRMVIESKFLADDISRVRACQTVNVQRTDQHHASRTRPQNRIQKILRSNDGAGKNCCWESAHFCSQVVHHPDSIHGASDLHRRKKIAPHDFTLAGLLNPARCDRGFTRFAEQTTDPG